MRIAGLYSFKNGKCEVAARYPHLRVDVNAAIKAVDPARHKTKAGKEKTMPGGLQYSPQSLIAPSR